ncbi:HAMP domain-containing protein [Ruminococcus sp. CLA-AA-H200]|uniref:histidine kinase n=1 Tax=Ruminococcus turbiniformis TaxID=2881258 RepID=A0ABS8FV44_9FIRM|nr:ATP-binding protein [Ruminococcus turbiniformis]MCC2253861.1 HAMP domain-containing protein [Ruminococcus turbiniformis]
MRRISLKLKLTLMYTFFMLLLTCAALAILFSLSSREVLTSTQAKLERRVQESVEDISVRSEALRVDSDFYSVAGDVYLSLYDTNMYFLYGRLPHGFSQQPEFSDGEMRTIRDGNREWYVYDMAVAVSDTQTVYVRGVTSITDAEESFAVTVRFALILLPVMVLAIAFIGYRFTRRTLLPVRKITRTVREIRADADLSRRIGITEGDEKERDEIYVLAATFDDMLSELEEVFRREQQFTSDASHELRTPVSVILAQCGMLLSDDTLTKDQREQIGLIERKAKGMSDMISQLLFLSRADQGRQPIHREWLNISELTEMTAEEQQILADADGRGIRVKTKISPELYAKVDETLYIRLLVNLLSNAVRYSRDGGIVEVELYAEPAFAGENGDAEERRSGDADGAGNGSGDVRRAGDVKQADVVCGSVTDHGTGMSEETLLHIWERFYRADSSRTDSGHSGLGLSMVRWIVRAHGGSVTAESREGEGSRFVFRLPVDGGESGENEKNENF